MKYFLIISISLLLASPAYAAKQIKGGIPNVTPLQPPAAGVGANYSKNIQYSDSNRPAPLLQQQPATVPQVVTIQKELIQQKHRSYPWGLTLTIILGLGTLFLVWKNTRNP